MRRRIYVGHSGDFDFKNILYRPILESKLNTAYDFTFPHESTSMPFNSRTFLKNCDGMIAEISYPSTGLGIELGWADLYEIPIIALYQKGKQPSKSTKVITSDFISYNDSKELIRKLSSTLDKRFT
jgi:hypothetical protein